jgi:hypothetical protein
MSYATLQIVFSIIASAQGIGWRRVVFFVIEATICLLVTHGFRALMNKWRWLNIGIPQIIRTGGTATCENTAPCRMRGLAWALSERSSTPRAWRTFAM